MLTHPIAIRLTAHDQKGRQVAEVRGKGDGQYLKYAVTSVLDRMYEQLPAEQTWTIIQVNVVREEAT